MRTAAEFWDWFKENEANFFFLNQIDREDEKERILDHFQAHLHKYSEDLFFEIGGYPDEIQDLIITAAGDPSFFSAAEDLVKQAPSLENWNVIALKPANPEQFVTTFKGITLDIQTMYFIPLISKSSSKIGLRIYVDNYAPTEKEDFLTASYIALDTLLGEKSNALDIGYVEIENLPPVSERDDLIEFKGLPRYIKWKKSRTER